MEAFVHTLLFLAGVLGTVLFPIAVVLLAEIVIKAIRRAIMMFRHRKDWK